LRRHDTHSSPRFPACRRLAFAGMIFFYTLLLCYRYYCWPLLSQSPCIVPVPPAPRATRRPRDELAAAAAPGTRRRRDDRKNRTGDDGRRRRETFSVVESMLTCMLHDAARSNFGGDLFLFPLSPPLPSPRSVRVHVAMIRTVFLFPLAQYVCLSGKVWTSLVAQRTSWAGYIMRA
jgi:hypothetical protein